MKILTISSTRPDFIRLMPTVNRLDKYFGDKHKLVWLGQNFDPCLADQFFKEFKRQPDIKLDNTDKHIGVNYISYALPLMEKILKEEQPDCVLTLGDTNGTLVASMMAKKMGIVNFHVEAGNRCFDPARVPEEVNRYMIDSIADWHLCYTQRAREHLLAEGKRIDRCVVVGNPIVEAIDDAKPLGAPNGDDYCLFTIHRKENIDNEERLNEIIQNFINMPYKSKIILHPSFKSKADYKAIVHKDIELMEPTNFRDFLSLEANAKCIITDSGTVPEEAHMFGVPCVLLRFSTERPELLEKNSMIVCSEPYRLRKAVDMAIDMNGKQLPIPEYHYQASSNIVKLLMRWKDD
ncbi:MAG: UDP-N-acetyl glucosamine 2-epimerase [bacterium]|nr:UDP-N-acetyl glucosamine 2-epimerase [bacterium]